MAELLTTKDILAALDRIIRNAEKYICIFTYNIKIDPNYLVRLRNASKRGVQITVVFGVQSGDLKVIEELKKIQNCTVHYKEFLHAKFYYSEKELLIGSMNLSEASAKNNIELGVLFSNDEYKEIIKKVKREAKEIIDDSNLWEENGSNLTNKKIDYSGLKRVSHKSGTCIRCHILVPFDPLKPLCINCYQIWVEWENFHYPENYCHSCGKEKNTISMNSPMCSSCLN